MTLKDKILQCKEMGISIKYIAEQVNIKPTTLYAFTSGKRNLSPEKQEKIEKFLSIYFIKGD